MSQVEKFFEALGKDPRAKEIFGKDKPDTEDEVVASYAKVAKALGFALSDDEIREEIRIRTAAQKANTAKAQEAIQELSLDDSLPCTRLWQLPSGVVMHTRRRIYKTGRNSSQQQRR